jgi:hypothetical protein
LNPERPSLFLPFRATGCTSRNSSGDQVKEISDVSAPDDAPKRSSSAGRSTDSIPRSPRYHANAGLVLSVVAPPVDPLVDEARADDHPSVQRRRTVGAEIAPRTAGPLYGLTQALVPARLRQADRACHSSPKASERLGRAPSASGIRLRAGPRRASRRRLVPRQRVKVRRARR